MLYNKRYVNCSDDSYTSIVYVYCKKRPVIKIFRFLIAGRPVNSCTCGLNVAGDTHCKRDK